ncbi:MAG: hypothetical protein K6U11_03740 [bacterium]|nr:hypothetical protein [bacterium]
MIASTVFFELLKFIDCVIIYYTVVFRCDNQRDINLCLYLIMGVGFFFSVRGIIQYLGGADRSFWLLANELSGPFDNSDVFAGYLIMVILPGLGVMTAPLLHFMSNTILLATLSGLAMSRYFQEKSRLKEPSYIRDSSF